MSLQSKIAVLANGVRLAYAEAGAPNGPPVVLLHGYSDTQRSFDLLAPHLPRGWRVLAPTQRGHGDSDKPSHGYALKDFAEDVALFMDAVDAPRALIVGHSMGSAVALRFVADHRDRTQGLALLGAFADFADNPGVAELIATVDGFTDPIDPGFVRGFQESTLANPVPDGFLDMVIGESLKAPAHVWRGAARGLAGANLPDAIGKVSAPTLIVWGDQDVFCPEADQFVLRDSLPEARLAILPGVGHALHWEQPARVAGELIAFADALARPRRAAAS